MAVPAFFFPHNLLKAFYNKSTTILIIFFPLVVFHWMLPFITEIGPGHDFIKAISLIQTEYLCALKTGTFPLNINCCNVQTNLLSGPVGMLYSPVSYLILMLPGSLTGDIIHWNMVFKLLAIPLVHLFLFNFIKKMQKDTIIALILSTITVYSPRILFSFYLGPEIETWTGYLLLCAATGFYCLKASGFKGPLAIIGSTYWLVGSGYPEPIYFCLIGAFIFILVIPFFINTILPNRHFSAKELFRFWSLVFLYGFIGIMLSAAFLCPMYFDAISDTMLRHQNYAQSCLNTDGFWGFAHNFFSPFRTGFMGSMFGNSPLLLGPVLIPVLLIYRIKIPWVIWFLLGIIALICLFAVGDKTPVHYFFWKNLPFCSATRFPARITIILPVFFLLLLVWMFKRTGMIINLSGISVPMISAFACLALLINIVFIFFVSEEVKQNISGIALFNLRIIPYWAEPVFKGTGVFILMATALYGLKINPSFRLVVIVVLLIGTGLQIILLFRYAPVPRQIIMQYERVTYKQYQLHRRKSMNVCASILYPSDNALFPDDVLQQNKRYFSEPYLGKIYRNSINTKTLDLAYDILNGQRKQNEVVVEKYRGNRITESLSNKCAKAIDHVSLLYSSYNRMIFKTKACQPSFFVFSYNRTGHWQAWVNDEKEETYRANGHAHAVPIRAGESIVEFRYWSWPAFWGMLISCATLGAIGIIFCLRGMRKPAGYIIALGPIIVACGLFLLWYSSLYKGENLRTQYTWQSPHPGSSKNIAFGKPTRMVLNSYERLDFDLIHTSRNGVDGSPDFSSCFITSYQINPWWEVDLLHPETLGTIVIHNSLQGKETNRILYNFPDCVNVSKKYDFLVLENQPSDFNLTPLILAVSIDGKNWQSTQIYDIPKDRPLIIKPEQPVTARYIRIIASGECRLCLNEVEVYPPLPEESSEIKNANE